MAALSPLTKRTPPLIYSSIYGENMIQCSVHPQETSHGFHQDKDGKWLGLIVSPVKWSSSNPMFEEDSHLPSKSVETQEIFLTWNIILTSDPYLRECSLESPTQNPRCHFSCARRTGFFFV